MPPTQVVIYREKPGEVPLLEWLDNLPVKVQDKCIAVIELLKERGYELRRPHCDILDKGIYELRVRSGNVHYRILYGFAGKNIVLLSHGCLKKAKVPKGQIERAVTNYSKFMKDPKTHTYCGEL